jgi:hypothetical protein
MHFPLHEEGIPMVDSSPAQQDGAIVRHIASFLSLADASSMAGGASEGLGPVASWSSFLTTPETPGLMALSPDERMGDDSQDSGYVDEEALNKRLQDRQRRFVKLRLATAVFSHPQSLRQFCSKAHKAAMSIQKARIPPPETLREPTNPNIFEFTIKSILQNVPLSVLLQLLDSLRETLLDTSFAGVTITVDSINGLVNAVVHLLERIRHAVTHFRFSSASEVLVSGIQSVTTGVGSAALNRRSARDYHHNNTVMLEHSGLGGGIAANQALIDKLSTINAAAHVIAYREREDEALTRHAKKRVQRMMHYDVSLRPFVATVVLPKSRSSSSALSRQSTFGNVDFPGRALDDANGSPNDDYSSPPSPFMCTPKSFPPTPASRSLVMARGTKFAEDVIFLARDKLRVEDGLDSDNERTRAMAKALREASRLAVFNAADIGSGIMLTCGQHVATKVGNVLYCSTRSMVPVLRNCYAYFEMTVLPTMSLQASMSTLSIGLSTLEMPLNTLVGAWKGSVGLYTSGQLLTAGQWCSPLDPTQSSYGSNATVGCLVCLDDGSAFETWDGIMVAASVTFNVNGQVVSPPVRTTPMGGHEQLSKQFPGLVPHSSTLPLLVPVEEELFPTLTLHSPGTQVMCRFSSEDIRATCREQIGAPNGVPVYTVDGSVLFQSDQGNSEDESEDEQSYEAEES